jgi:hypothetical protein
MRTFILLCLLNFIALTANSTGQAGDILIWDNEKLQLFSNPLESYPNFSQIRNKLFGTVPLRLSTGCVRGYIAEWQIVENTLFLTNIYDCLDQKIRADLNTLFPGKLKNGRIQADWVDEVLIVPKGKCLYYINLGYKSIYETEFELTIKSGKLIAERKYDNSETRISVFTQNTDSLLKFVYSNILWDKLPDTKNKSMKVSLTLISTGTNKPEIRISRGSGNKIFDIEAVRVASTIPNWDVCIQKEKVLRQSFHLPIIFNDEMRKKYTH